MKHDTAGDPMTGLKWTRKATEKVAKELRALDIEISAKSVGKLLKKMDFSLRVNHKKRSNGSPKQRDEQFCHIAELRERFAAAGDPIISVDTKKKEQVGAFKNPGRTWEQQPIIVNDHDFRTLAKGVAIPRGLYDMTSNRGTVHVGTTYDTADFAVDSIHKWWREEGRRRYPNSNHILVLADGGGSNGSRCRLWKYGLQHTLCNRNDITVTVAHYPPGTSKWNPIEHRLFSEISKNWAGHPLYSYETVLKHIRKTKTETGLQVRAQLVRKQYRKGRKISDADMLALSLEPSATLPQWNYTIRPTETAK